MKKVKKTWGFEKWLVNTRKYCGKILFIRKGCKSSLHYHKEKDETFYINSGKIKLVISGRRRIMRKGDYQRIVPLVRHQFVGLEDSEIIEFSTHHFDFDTCRISR